MLKREGVDAYHNEDWDSTLEPGRVRWAGQCVCVVSSGAMWAS